MKAMKLTITSTDEVAEMPDGTRFRVWDSEVDGTPVKVMVVSIAVPTSAPQSVHEKLASELHTRPDFDRMQPRIVPAAIDGRLLN